MSDDDIVESLQALGTRFDRFDDRLEHLENIAQAEFNLRESAELEADEASLSSFEKRLTFLQKWGWVIGLIGVIFSAGIGYAMFLGVNATDDEVEQKIDGAFLKHNDYIDPSAIDPTTHRPVGHHPDLREAIHTNTKAIETMAETQKTLSETQGKLDKRSRYQYEFTKWEVKKAECRRKRSCTRRDMEKPPKLEELEAELIND